MGPIFMSEKIIPRDPFYFVEDKDGNTSIQKRGCKGQLSIKLMEAEELITLTKKDFEKVVEQNGVVAYNYSPTHSIEFKDGRRISTYSYIIMSPENEKHTLAFTLKTCHGCFIRNELISIYELETATHGDTLFHVDRIYEAISEFHNSSNPQFDSHSFKAKRRWNVGRVIDPDGILQVMFIEGLRKDQNGKFCRMVLDTEKTDFNLTVTRKTVVDSTCGNYGKDCEKTCKGMVE
jgi:hypothetical protein